MVNLTDEEKLAIELYEGESSQILALLLFIGTGNINNYISISDKVIVYNSYLKAVRQQRGR